MGPAGGMACGWGKGIVVADALTMIADLPFTVRLTHPMLPPCRTPQREDPA
jgi:hypothetical protein